MQALPRLDRAMGTKSRETIYGASIRAAAEKAAEAGICSSRRRSPSRSRQRKVTRSKIAHLNDRFAPILLQKSAAKDGSLGHFAKDERL
jgi:hypothetical protein